MADAPARPLLTYVKRYCALYKQDADFAATVDWLTKAIPRYRAGGVLHEMDHFFEQEHVYRGVFEHDGSYKGGVINYQKRKFRLAPGGPFVKIYVIVSVRVRDAEHAPGTRVDATARETFDMLSSETVALRRRIRHIAELAKAALTAPN